MIMSNIISPLESGLSQLKKHIDLQVESLSNYAKKPNANQLFIDRKSSDINELINAYNLIEKAHYDLEIFYPVASSVNSIYKNNTEIELIKLNIFLKPELTNRICQITFNPFGK